MNDADLNIGRFREAADLDDPRLKVRVTGRRCIIPDCRKVSVIVGIIVAHLDEDDFVLSAFNFDDLFRGQIYPRPSAPVVSEFVPSSLAADFREAWAISSLSPKSSATLARRCLQGMIRDFCGIRERTLYDEIKKLEALLGEDRLPKGVEGETIDAMLALKDLGNIGAHMTEVDGAIIDVDPGEAEALLGLIEMLFADWYVARGKRKARLAGIKAIAEAKKPGPSARPSDA